MLYSWLSLLLITHKGGKMRLWEKVKSVGNGIITAGGLIVILLLWIVVIIQEIIRLGLARIKGKETYIAERDKQFMRRWDI